MDDMPVFTEFMRFGANQGALTAHDAFALDERQLPLSWDTFGIMAPQTSELAALHKDSAAYARSVVYAEVLNIEDGSRSIG